MSQIMNGGIRLGILQAAKKYCEEKGEPFKAEFQEEIDKLDALPKNVWIDLDDNGNPISREEADKAFEDHLNQFQVIK